MKTASLTIKEISSLSGYSVSTVSKALNNKDDISLETRKTIKDIARKFNYVPNKYAVALRGRKMKSIAIILPTVTELKYNRSLHYLQRKAIDAGYRVLLFQTFNSVKLQKRYIKSLNDGSVDGIFMIFSSKEVCTEHEQLNSSLIFINLEGNRTTKSIEKLVSNKLNDFLEVMSGINS